MKLIIINGLPGTGKTTIAKPLSTRLAMPLVAKDTVKEFLFDTIGVGDREWSRMLGKVSSEFVYSLADTLLTNGHSVIIESAFETAFAKPVIESFIEKYHPDTFEIYCTTDKETRRKRFIDRNKSGVRHVGHVDQASYLEESEPEPLEKYARLGIGKVININTTTEEIDIDHLADQLR